MTLKSLHCSDCCLSLKGSSGFEWRPVDPRKGEGSLEWNLRSAAGTAEGHLHNKDGGEDL